jgi:hypothetical protein
MHTELFTRRALQAALACDLPADVARHVRLALSVMNSNGYPTHDELRNIIGSNWVVARRTTRIVREYGESVLCLSPKKLDEAEIRALEMRAV